ncbi:hypothetical protein [Actinomadura vinacea]
MNILSPAPSQPRWIVWAAYAVPLCVLPSVLWRLALVVGLFDEHEAAPLGVTWGERLYVPSLSIISMGLALLTLGLVQPWGRVVPRWVPFLGGRPVPTLAAVIPATAGSVALFGLCAYVVLNGIFSWVDRGLVLIGDDQGAQMPTGLAGNLVALCYAPLFAWAPLLAIVTIAYYKTRSAEDRPGGGRLAS